jgi:hypothetical protein
MTFRWLLRVAEELDRRFPPKVVVTQADYDGLQERVHRQSKDLAKFSGELMVERQRIGDLEKSLSALKEGVVKGDIPVTTSERARLRDDFVSGNWTRLPQAVAAEANK